MARWQMADGDGRMAEVDGGCADGQSGGGSGHRQRVPGACSLQVGAGCTWTAVKMG